MSPYSSFSRIVRLFSLRGHQATDQKLILLLVSFATVLLAISRFEAHWIDNLFYFLALTIFPLSFVALFFSLYGRRKRKG